ncbi:spectrin beta chain [Anaeramoeba flamelloides]|uniref:Spectrin beta chain n=1 Tax=Anaeramoeba flamelloides TaxID=1746091 RepID=A0ABQ8Y3N4_9EUKA|nr:spectrin beta chain [Anaeramoeba flamelloides]
MFDGSSSYESSSSEEDTSSGSSDSSSSAKPKKKQNITMATLLQASSSSSESESESGSGSGSGTSESGSGSGSGSGTSESGSETSGSEYDESSSEGSGAEVLEYTPLTNQNNSNRSSTNNLIEKSILLKWCQEELKDYKSIKIDDFGYSWVDGQAFCAIIHRYKPEMLDYPSLDKTGKLDNLDLAFDIAEEQLGIIIYLDAEELLTEEPDEKAIYLQLIEFYDYFSKLTPCGKKKTSPISQEKDTKKETQQKKEIKSEQKVEEKQKQKQKEKEKEKENKNEKEKEKEKQKQKQKQDEDKKKSKDQEKKKESKEEQDKDKKKEKTKEEKDKVKKKTKDKNKTTEEDWEIVDKSSQKEKEEETKKTKTTKNEEKKLKRRTRLMQKLNLTKIMDTEKNETDENKKTKKQTKTKGKTKGFSKKFGKRNKKNKKTDQEEGVQEKEKKPKRKKPKKKPKKKVKKKKKEKKQVTIKPEDILKKLKEKEKLAKERERLEEEERKKMNKYQLRFVTKYEDNKETNKDSIYYSIKVEDPEKKGTGRSAYISYNIQFKYRNKEEEKKDSNEWNFIERRFSDFHWLDSSLSSGYPQFIRPSIPEKSMTKKFQGEFRKRAFQRYLVKLNNHPVLSITPEVKLFFETKDSKKLQKTKKTVFGKYPEHVQNKINQFIGNNEGNNEFIEQRQKKFPQFIDSNKNLVKSSITKIAEVESKSANTFANFPPKLISVIDHLKQKDKNEEETVSSDDYIKTFNQCLSNVSNIFQDTSKKTTFNVSEPMLEYCPELKKNTIFNHYKKILSNRNKVKKDFDNKKTKIKKLSGIKLKKAQKELENTQNKLEIEEKIVSNTTDLITGELKSHQNSLKIDYRAMLLNFMIEKYTVHNQIFEQWEKVINVLSQFKEEEKKSKIEKKVETNNSKTKEIKSVPKKEKEDGNDSQSSSSESDED